MPPEWVGTLIPDLRANFKYPIPHGKPSWTPNSASSSSISCHVPSSASYDPSGLSLSDGVGMMKHPRLKIANLPIYINSPYAHTLQIHTLFRCFFVCLSSVPLIESIDRSHGRVVRVFNHRLKVAFRIRETVVWISFGFIHVVRKQLRNGEVRIERKRIRFCEELEGQRETDRRETALRKQHGFERN
uniref:Uncharacterized protein n=1 Tax=Timema poppense TaxID=170557 RepID=A0A7R9GU89_TIMPO|nr:unnamed protein product [Timema poppensis]